MKRHVLVLVAALACLGSLMAAGCSGPQTPNHGAPVAPKAPTEAPKPLDIEGLVKSGEAPGVIRKRIDEYAAARIAAAKAEAAVAREEAKQEARDDFADSVKTWTGWAMGALALIGVLAVVASFLPWFPWINTRDALTALAAVAVLNLTRYALLRYGVGAADVVVWVSIGLAVLAALGVGVPVGWSWYRRVVLKDAARVATSGDTRAATALESQARGWTSDSPKHRSLRKSLLSVRSLDKGMKLQTPGGPSDV